MGLSSKSKVISGLALVSAIVAGCGGGGGSSTPASSTPAAGITQGSTVCAAATGSVALTAVNPVTTGTLPLVLGSCEQYEASTSPTKSATGFKDPGANAAVVYSPATAQYQITLPLLATGATTTVSTPIVLPGGLTAYSFGNLAGKSFQNVLDASTGAAATAYDYANTTSTTGGKVMDLYHSRFGLFSRFADRTLGYYGGWAQGNNPGSTPALPSGKVTFRGVMVGVIGPSSTNTAPGTAAGFSADVVMTVNFALPNQPLESIAISTFGFSANGAQINSAQIGTGGAVVSSTLDTGVKAISASFTTPSAAPASGIQTGKIAGNFFGDSAGGITELVGKLAFTAADGRNAVGSFGVRVPNAGNSIVGP
jgi:hypothetical protein